MPQQRDPLHWHILDTVVGTVDLVLMTPPFGERGKVWYVEEITVCNRDGSGGLVDIGVLDGNRYIDHETLTLTTAGLYYLAHLKMTLLTDYHVYARFRYDATGEAPCDNGDVCELNINGYVLEPFTSP